MDLVMNFNYSNSQSIYAFGTFSSESDIRHNIRRKMHNNHINDYTVSMSDINDRIISINSDIIKIESFEIDGLKLRFKAPFYLNYYKNEKYYQYEDDNLNYFGVAETLEEMVEEFKEDIFADWVMYVEQKEVKLSKRALILRNKLKMLLERID